MPAAGVQLYKPDAAFDEPASDQAVAAEFVRRPFTDAILVECRLRLLRPIDRLGRFGLHAIREFV
jgi:hypothetical protein